MTKQTQRLALILIFILISNEMISTDDNGAINSNWMSTNLEVSEFRNGDTILFAKTIEEWRYAAQNKEPACCYFNYDSVNSKQHGKLYNRYAIIDKRGLAPEGYRIPTLDDWDMFKDSINHIVFYDIRKLDSLGINIEIPDIESIKTNTPMFGSCYLDGTMATSPSWDFWTTSLSKDGYPIIIMINHPYMKSLESHPANGEYVRCIKD